MFIHPKFRFELLRSISVLCFQACSGEWRRGKPSVPQPHPEGDEEHKAKLLLHFENDLEEHFFW